ncbi:MAG: hypothetical protein AMXMBFR64_04990 [Myxococcales bacterium]
MANPERPAASRKARDIAPARYVQAAEERAAAELAGVDVDAVAREKQAEHDQARRELDATLLRGRSPFARKMFRLFAVADLDTCAGLVGLCFAEQHEERQAAVAAAAAAQADAERLEDEAAKSRPVNPMLQLDGVAPPAARKKAPRIVAVAGPVIDHRSRRGYVELTTLLKQVVEAKLSRHDDGLDEGPRAATVVFEGPPAANASNLPPEG